MASSSLARLSARSVISMLCAWMDASVDVSCFPTPGKDGPRMEHPFSCEFTRPKEQPREVRCMQWSVAVFFEILFDFEGSHAAGAGGGDGLAVAAVLHVAAGIDAGNDNAVAGGEDVVAGVDVAFAVEIDLALEHFGVGIVADTEKEAADGEHA